MTTKTLEKPVGRACWRVTWNEDPTVTERALTVGAQLLEVNSFYYFTRRGGSQLIP